MQAVSAAARSVRSDADRASYSILEAGRSTGDLFEVGSGAEGAAGTSENNDALLPPPLLAISAKPRAIQPSPGNSYRLAAKVIGYAKVAFAVPDSCAGDVLGSVARFTPSIRTHFCR
jgi:hypothetical protein